MGWNKIQLNEYGLGWVKNRFHSSWFGSNGLEWVTTSYRGFCWVSLDQSDGTGWLPARALVRRHY